MSNKNNLRYALGALALSVSAASLAAPSEAQQFTEFWTPGKPNPSICKSPLLVSTPLGLPRCLQASNVVKRLQKLEDIASLNDEMCIRDRFPSLPCIVPGRGHGCARGGVLPCYCRSSCWPPPASPS